MAQKRYSIAPDGKASTVTIATDATSLGSDVMRLIVTDTINQRQAIALMEFIKHAYLQDEYPFA